MKDRLITIAGGLLAFAVLFMLLAPTEPDPGEAVSRPLSSDRGRAGLEGLARWLEQGGARTDVLARRYTALASDLDLSPTGNLLIVSLPQYTPSRAQEREALRAWLAQGNTALVLMAAGDAPMWMMGTAGWDLDPFLESFGMALASTSESAESDEKPRRDASADGNANGNADDPGEDERDWSALTDLEAWLASDPVTLEPRFPHPLTREVERVLTRSMREFDPGWYLTGAERGRVLLPLLAEKREQGDAPAFWEVRVGAGRMWVSRYSDLFANASLGDADNARFAANLVTAALGRNGVVIFDDMHQGVSDLYDAKAFFSDPRFITTMAFVVVFWLLYLVGRSRRLAPPRESVSRYYAADLARAMAGFFFRRLSPATVERELFAFYFNDIRGRYGLPTNGQPVWSILSGAPRVDGDDVRELQAHYRRAASDRSSSLVALARLMQRTRNDLL